MVATNPERPVIGLSRKRKRETTKEKINGLEKIVKKQCAEAEDDDLDLSLRFNKLFANMDCQLLADYIAQRTRKFEKDLSSLELEDRYIPGKYPMMPFSVHWI